MRVRERPAVLGPLAAFCAMGVFWGAWDALLPATKRATGATDGQLGLALAVALGAALPAMWLTGRAVDRWGGRVLPVVLTVFAAAAPLSTFARSPGWLLVLLIPLGAGSGATDVAMNSDIAVAERGGTSIMHGAHALFSASLLVASLLTGVARAAGAGRLAVLGTAALVMAGALVLSVRNHAGSYESAPVRARPSRLLLALGALCALSFLVEGGLEQWSAIHLEDTLGTGPFLGSLAPALYAGAMVAGRTFGQLRLSRLGTRRLLVGAGAVAAVGTAVLAAAPGPAVALGGVAIAGFAVALAAPTLFTAAGAAAPPGQGGSAIALVTTLGYGGFLVGPLLVGGVAGWAGLRWGLALLAVAATAMAAGGSRVGHAPLGSDP